MRSPRRCASCPRTRSKEVETGHLPPRLSCALLLAALEPGCATARNYLDPAGPRYEANYAVRARSFTGRVRVVTFNIQHARRVDLALAALVDREPLRDPDLLLLQEMDARGVDTLARALELNYVYFPASVYPTTRRDFGNAVLSPWPIERAWKLPLPHTSRVVRQARVAVAVRVRIGALGVRVYSVHFGSPFGASPGHRRDQADVVIADARGSPDPVVVGGDLNSSGLGKRFVAAGFAWPTERVGATTRRFSFDHVFARGLAAMPSGAGVVREVTDASDHRPVWAVLAAPAQTDASAWLGGLRAGWSAGIVAAEARDCGVASGP